MHSVPDSAARAHFDELTREQVEAAIRGMARAGHTDYTIAAATRLAVEQIRRVLGRLPEDRR